MVSSFRVTGIIFRSLFSYQHVSISWTWPFTEYPTGEAGDSGCPQSSGLLTLRVCSFPVYRLVRLQGQQGDHSRRPVSKALRQPIFNRPVSSTVIILVIWFSEWYWPYVQVLFSTVQGHFKTMLLIIEIFHLFSRSSPSKTFYYFCALSLGTPSISNQFIKHIWKTVMTQASALGWRGKKMTAGMFLAYAEQKHKKMLFMERRTDP